MGIRQTIMNALSSKLTECVLGANVALRRQSEKKTIRSTGKHRIKIGSRAEFCCYLPSLTHSRNIVASPPMYGRR